MGDDRKKGAQATIERFRDAKSRWLDVALIAGIAASVALWLVAGQQPSDCSRFQYGASFAGEQARFASLVSHDVDGCSLSAGTAYVWLALAALGAVLVGILAAAALYRWWPRTGNTWVQWARPLAWLPIGMALLDVAQRVTVSVALATGDAATLRLGSVAAWLAPAFAWPKAIAAGVTVFLLVVTFVAKLSRVHQRRAGVVSQDPETGSSGGRLTDKPWNRPVEGLGICLSGGGIRAGSVALGVLGVLEADKRDTVADPGAPPRSLLQRARFVSSVSGGGYITSAWFNATGSPNWAVPAPGTSAPPPSMPPRVIGDTTRPGPPPELYDEDPAVVAGQSLYRHVATRQQYLRTGTGGITRSVVVAFLFLMVHLAVLAAAVALVAWPTGRVARSWYVFGGVGCTDNRDVPAATCAGPIDQDTSATHPSGVSCVNLAAPGEAPPLSSSLSRTRCFLRRTGIQQDVQASQIAPLVVFGGIGVILWAISLALRHTRRRRHLRVAGSAGFAIAGATALVVIIGPFLLDVVYPVLREGPAAVVAVVAGLTGLAATVYRAVAKAVTQRLVLFSGYLALGGLFLWGLFVAGNAAAREGILGLAFKGLLDRDLPIVRSDIFVYVVALVVIGAVFTQIEPRWWSLHTLYRARLGDAFATTTNRKHAAPWLRHTAQQDAPPHPDPDAGVSPVWPLRRSGERSLAEFAPGTEGPVHLICCTAARRPRTGTGIKGESFVVSPDQVTLYESVDSGPLLNVNAHAIPTPDYMKVLPTKRMRTESMWSALSGAAVAPAMGRMTRGTMGTVYAIANVRLGVWMPNPATVAIHQEGTKQKRYPRAGVMKLAKEIIGAWSVRDKHVYITDGGHWDNLGLVELLRRRCRTIICVDAAGDTPGSFATFRQAARLAELHVRARITNVPDPLPAGAPVPSAAYMILPIVYLDAAGDETPETGAIVYLPARIWATADLGLRGFAAEDVLFPNYSTGNQLLSDRQFQHLVDLGRCMAEQALACGDVRNEIDAAIG